MYLNDFKYKCNPKNPINIIGVENRIPILVEKNNEGTCKSLSAKSEILKLRKKFSDVLFIPGLKRSVNELYSFNEIRE